MILETIVKRHNPVISTGDTRNYEREIVLFFYEEFYYIKIQQKHTHNCTLFTPCQSQTLSLN